MKRVQVSSSNVASVGYDDESRTLEIGFHNGSVYQYFDVPRAVYESLISADSAGSYLHQNIKGVYRFARVE
jgi:hypothetical protein